MFFNSDHPSTVVKLWTYFKVSGIYYWEDRKLSLVANTVIPLYITIKISLRPQKYEREWAAAFVLLVLITVRLRVQWTVHSLLFSPQSLNAPIHLQHLNNICHPPNADLFPQQAHPSLPAKVLPTKSSEHSHTPFVFTPPLLCSRLSDASSFSRPLAGHACLTYSYTNYLGQGSQPPLHPIRMETVACPRWLNAPGSTCQHTPPSEAGHGGWAA